MPPKVLRAIFMLSLTVFLFAVPAGAQDNELLLDVAKKKVRAFEIKTVTVQGAPFRLSDLRGKVVFLNFWATWCGPCRLEMPSMERLHQKMKDRPFAMVAVNLQEPRVLVKKFVQDLKLTFTILMDPEGEIAGVYAAQNLPLTYIIDKKGNITRRALGPREWDGPAAVRLMEELMAEKG